jgi:formamidopyrimidine-DNA glycosylase
MGAIKITRVIFTFVGKHELRYLAMRKLGGLYLVPRGEFNQIDTIRKMGPEPLSPEFDFSTFKRIIEGKSAMVKALLLDQRFVAGIGNVYGDEILFQSRIRPNRKISELSRAELKNLFRETKRVLRKAIQRKAKLQGLEDSFLALHRGEGENCPRCGSRIQKVKISNRSSYYCERCQK